MSKLTAPIVACPRCAEKLPASTPMCPDCGFPLAAALHRSAIGCVLTLIGVGVLALAPNNWRYLGLIPLLVSVLIMATGPSKKRPSSGAV